MSGAVRFALLVSKFRGCLIGSLVGDCLGALPEVEQVLAAAGVAAGPATVRRMVAAEDKLHENSPLPCSLNTRLLRCVGESLLHCREFDPEDMTQRLAHENAVSKTLTNVHGKQPGISSPHVLSAMNRNMADSTALRSAPIAMFFYGDLAKAVEVTRISSAINQRHYNFGTSSILHCLSIHLALQFDPIYPLNVELFMDRLVSNMAEVEASVERTNRQGPVVVNHKKQSLHQLEAVREMLRLRYSLPKAVTRLDEISSDKASVSAALYAFLQAQQHRETESETPLERVLHQTLSVSQSGDALASLACGITGAFHGIEAVPMGMRKRCEGLSETGKLADRLALQFETQPGVYEKAEMSLVQSL